MTVFKSLVCLFVLTCGSCLLANAQETVTLSLENRPLSEFISQIEQKTDCSFIFSKDMVDMSLMVTVEASSRPLPEVLDAALNPLGIRWQMEERHIILTPFHAGEVTVTGRVTVAGSDEPVIGVSVYVEGMESVGAITDIDGSYVIRTDVPDPVLVFSYMGFRNERVPVAGRSRIDVEMEEDAQQLDELVVVAYGVQKKANLSGAVSSVDFSAAGENRILTNVSSGLQGLSAGLLAQQSSGEPGADGASILIRGVGTLNNTSPLVVIDGIVGEIDDVNPQDIASMSILKDAASSAIYGSRAANGVILITTKTGSKEKIQIRYNVHGGIQSVSCPIDIVSDYPTYMEAINTAMKNSGNVPPYSEATIAEWRQNSVSDPTVYPNTDWFRYMFKPAYIMEHNLQASGGTDRINFICSLGYLSNDGMMPKTSYDRYSFRLGVSARLTRWLRLNANINGYHGIQGGVDVSTVMTTIGNSSPGTLPVHPDGRFGGEWAPGSNVSAGNALQEISSYDRTTRNTKLNGKVGLDIDVTKHLRWMNTLAVSVNFNSLSQMNYANIEKWDFKHDVVLTTTGAVQTQLTESYARKHNIILDSWLQYDDFIAGNEDHTLSAMLGYNQEYNQYHDSYINALDVLSNDTPVLNAATTPSKITGTFTDSAVQSFFGRINYDWKGRYISGGDFRVEKGVYTVGPEEDSFPVPVFAAFEPQASCGEKWVEVLRTKALAEYAFTVTVQANDTRDSRSAVIVFSRPDDGGLAGQVTVIQEAPVQPVSLDITVDGSGSIYGDGVLESVTMTADMAFTEDGQTSLSGNFSSGASMDAARTVRLDILPADFTSSGFSLDFLLESGQAFRVDIFPQEEYLSGGQYDVKVENIDALISAGTAEPVFHDLVANEGGRANCYVITHGGYYKYAADYPSNDKTYPIDAVSADWLWSTGEEPLVKEVSYSQTTKNIYFNVRPGSSGNSVIAAKDASGNIVWSWHIWMLQEDPRAGHHYTRGPDWQLMNCNLGATSCNEGDVGAYGLYYQWGRKDPFPGASVPGGTGNSTEIGAFGDKTQQYVINGAEFSSTGNRNTAAEGDVAWSISHPTTMIHANGQDGALGLEYTWLYTSSVDDALKLWHSGNDGSSSITSRNGKTIYDPCPAGWCIPVDVDHSWYSAWNIANMQKETAADVYGFNYVNPAVPGVGIYYPAAGYRNAGVLADLGLIARYWTAKSQVQNGTRFVAGVTEVNLYSDSVKSGTARTVWALPVRCMKM